MVPNRVTFGDNAAYQLGTSDGSLANDKEGGPHSTFSENFEDSGSVLRMRSVIKREGDHA
jgi:hypothetical protein